MARVGAPAHGMASTRPESQPPIIHVAEQYSNPVSPEAQEARVMGGTVPPPADHPPGAPASSNQHPSNRVRLGRSAWVPCMRDPHMGNVHVMELVILHGVCW